MRRLFRLAIFLLWLIPVSFLRGQVVQADLDFSTDTMAVGAPVEAVLSLSHPAHVRLLLPRDRRIFLPFERMGTDTIREITTEGLSVTKLRYTLRSFRMDSLQYLQLPYGWISGLDTVQAESPLATIRLIRRLPDSVENPHLMIEDGLLLLQDPPNYTLYFLLSMAGLAVLVVLTFVLRKPITRALATWRVRREWQWVMRQTKKIEQLQDDQVEFFVQLNHLWKEQLDPGGDPMLGSMTTTELQAVIDRLLPALEDHERKSLIEAAQTGDRVIYAGETLEDYEQTEHLNRIRNILKHEYRRRMEMTWQGENFRSEVSRPEIAS